MKSLAKKHAELENLSIGGTNFRLSPGLLHVYAADFLAAAKAAPQSRFSPAQRHLVCHALELGLKAFLSLKGQTLIKLADNFGHQLESLLGQSERHGIAAIADLDDRQLSEIRRASKYHHEKVFQYPALGEACVAYPHDPDVEVLLEAATKLIETLRERCLGA